jgi:hypothetical protein
MSYFLSGVEFPIDLKFIKSNYQDCDYLNKVHTPDDDIEQADLKHGSNHDGKDSLLDKEKKHVHKDVQKLS